jgi:hypothetical protein
LLALTPIVHVLVLSSQTGVVPFEVALIEKSPYSLAGSLETTLEAAVEETVLAAVEVVAVEVELVVEVAAVVQPASKARQARENKG